VDRCQVTGLKLPALLQVGGVAGRLKLGTLPVNNSKGDAATTNRPPDSLLDLLLQQKGAEGGVELLLQAVFA
jgi:hypothetical protein